MSFANFSNSNFVCKINGRPITDWGETATPFTSEPIDPKSILRRGQGGRALRLDRTNPGRRITLSLNPGSPDSAFMQGLFESKANITMHTQQIGTLEASIATEGALTNDGSVGRAGMTISDDVFIIEFNIHNGTKGGE